MFLSSLIWSYSSNNIFEHILLDVISLISGSVLWFGYGYFIIRMAVRGFPQAVIGYVLAKGWWNLKSLRVLVLVANFIYVIQTHGFFQRLWMPTVSGTIEAGKFPWSLLILSVHDVWALLGAIILWFAYGYLVTRFAATESLRESLSGLWNGGWWKSPVLKVVGLSFLFLILVGWGLFGMLLLVWPVMLLLAVILELRRCFSQKNQPARTNFE